MQTKILTRELTWKGILVWVAILAGLVGIVYGGKQALDLVQVRLRSARAAKAELFDFLKSKSAARSFEIDTRAEAERASAALSNEMASLRAELGTLTNGVALLQQQVRTNRDEVSAVNQEVRRLRRVAGLAPRRAQGRNARTSATNAVGLATTLTNAAPADQSSTNLTFDLVAASETNQQYKAILEKEREANAKQEVVAKLQKEAQSLNWKINARSKDIQAKDKELSNLKTGHAAPTKMIREFQQKVQDATSWEVLYKAMGQELWLADQLLSSTNAAARQAGLQLAEQARQQALTVGESPWMAARICEAFIWPNLDVAEGGSNLAADQLLVSAGLTFRQADETNNYIKNAELLIKKARNPARADHARFQLGLLYENMGNFEASLAQYRAIQNTNSMVSAARRIPIVEERLKAMKGK